MLQTFLSPEIPKHREEKKESGYHRNLGTWSRMVHSLIPQRGSKHGLLRCRTVQNTPPQLAEIPGSWVSNTGSTFWPSVFESQCLQEEHSKERGCPDDQSSPTSLPGSLRQHKQVSSEQSSWEQAPEHHSHTGASGWSQILIQSKAPLPLTKSYQERPDRGSCWAGDLCPGADVPGILRAQCVPMSCR